MLEVGLIASRFLHYATVMVLFGVALFPLYTYASRVGDPPARLQHWLHRVLPIAGLLALLSGLAWGYFTVANMAGSLSSAADPDTLRSVLHETTFGKVWVARLSLLVALLVLLRSSYARIWHPDRTTPLVSAVLLASLAGVGHTQLHEGVMRCVHAGSDAAHLLAAGAWLGGLIVLGYLLALARPAPVAEATADASTALARFSSIGYIAVAALIASGLINSWFSVGSIGALVTNAYGQLLVVKLCLFAAMLALAGLNRYWLVPLMVSEKASGQPAASLQRLRRHVLSEQVLGLLIVLVVSLLGTMQPAIASAQ